MASTKGNREVETLITVLALFLGALGGWVVRDKTLAQLDRKSEIEPATTEATAQPVPALETELANLRSSEQQLVEEKARFETAAARVPELEAELDQARAKVEQLTRIADLGCDLSKRLQTMEHYVSDVGKHLEKTVEIYNNFVGSLESSVMPQARKFSEAEVEGTQAALSELAQIETVVRPVRSGRDLILGSSHEVGPTEHRGENGSAGGLGVTS
jgi:DNA repair exonuclease SbcCD ATPase subunit